MDREIVSIFSRNHYYWESNFCEIRLHDTLIVSIIWFSFFTHKEVKSGTNGLDKCICAITRITRVASIANILSMLTSVYYYWIDATSNEPLIYHSKIVVSISWSTRMVILSFSLCEFNIPVISSIIESLIITIWLKSFSLPYTIVPWEPGRTYTRHIDIWGSWNVSW